MQLVIIDGLDGCGKSTQALLLMQTLRRMRKTAYLRVHPEADNWFGLQARRYLNSAGKNAHFASAFFYMADVIRSILLYSWRKVDFVVFVRYLMGTAYLPTPLDTVAYNFFASIVPKSDSLFFLDVPAEEAAARIVKNRDTTEMFENLLDLRKVRVKALSLTRFDKWIVVDSTRPAGEVASELKKKMFEK